MPDLIFIIFIIDRVGRRKPLLWGTIGITIALICEAVVNSQIDTEKPQNGLSIAGVFFLFCVTVIFSRKLDGTSDIPISETNSSTVSWGPISWVYMAEVMPMQIRARGNAFATGIGNWLVCSYQFLFQII
jgi:hypothetical protein